MACAEHGRCSPRARGSAVVARSCEAGLTGAVRGVGWARSCEEGLTGVASRCESGGEVVVVALADGSDLGVLL
jgi:hypothetical protein